MRIDAKNLKNVFVIMACFIAVFAIAERAKAGPALSDLSASDYDGLVKELSGDFMHHSVQGAAPLGSIFGFEVGVVGGEESSPNFNALTTRAGGSGVSNLYQTGLLGVVSVPFGLTGEVIYFPKVAADGFSFNMTSAALKLSLDTTLLVLPINLAFRGFATMSNMSFDQTLSGTNVSITNKDTVTGLQLLVSPKLIIIEPYAGFGIVKAQNTLSVSGSASTIFDPSYTTSQSQADSLTSTQIIVGVTVKLLLLSVGAEYSNAFGASSYTGKLAFGF